MTITHKMVKGCEIGVPLGLFRRSLLIKVIVALALPFLFVLKVAAQTPASSFWTIATDTRDNYHSLTLANGMIGLLASAKPFQFEKVILNGVYDRYGTWGDGIANIVQGINFMNLDVSIDGGASMKDATNAQLTNWHQEIDMHGALFTARFTYGDKINVSYTSCALRQLPYNALLLVRMEATQDIDLSVANLFSGAESAVIHANSFKLEKIKRTIPLSSVQASSTTGKVTLAAATCFSFTGQFHPPIISDKSGSGFKQHLKKGEVIEFALNGAICTSAHFPDPKNESKRLALLGFLQGTDQLLALHIAEWKKLWKSDIILEGDEQAQKDIRLALYHLYSFAREGTAYSLSPMGLSSIDYNGHAFWDTEVWMYPVLLALHPEIARSLLAYRSEHLPQAKQNAIVNGYKGAMFPWESASDGTEETPVWALTGPFEHHITADIGIAFWNYYRVTQDLQWLKEKGYPVIKEVADFWVSRATRNSKGEYEIKNVVCADEYAENVDNNAFTNGAAIVALKNAATAARVLKLIPDPEWEAVAKHIPIRYFPDSVVREYDGYKGQMIKQADANLLSYPLQLLSPPVDKKTLEYYEGKVDKKQGPAMTHGIFSIISSKLGDPEKAYEYFLESYKPNSRPPFGVLAETATDENPYFATGAGAMLQAVIYGFGGLKITRNGIEQTAVKLPKKWKKLTITGVGKDQRTFVLESKRF